MPEATRDGKTTALSSTFTADDTRLITGGANKAVCLLQLGQQLPPNGVHRWIGVHDAPITHVAFIASSKLAVSGALEKKVKLWDARS
jgi:WD40 repeat protein